jgi:1,4-dihydroxy-2-naphthoyl-CoA hydrolase
MRYALGGLVSENEGTAGPDLEAAVAQMPFAAALGVVLDAARPDEVRGRLAWAPERCTTAGTMHGGA